MPARDLPASVGPAEPLDCGVMPELPPAQPDAELRFAHYRVERSPDGSPWKLGSGAMGVTYKAFDERLRIEVALKVIAPAQVDEAKAQALFLREARAATRVRHPNVASVVFLNDKPGNFFYAMEFIAGESLADWLRTRGAPPREMAIGFATQIARGLGAIHHQQIVHRDLKPANLMIVAAEAVKTHVGTDSDPDAWQIKIIDFGLARGFGGGGLGTEADAQTIGFRGTALYASPEQCEERGQIDGRSDLYSLGCILWEMLTGAPPFRTRTHRELLNQHVSGSHPLERLAHLPANLQAVLVRLLAKDPADRFSNAHAVVEALTGCLERTRRGEEPSPASGLTTQESKAPLVLTAVTVSIPSDRAKTASPATNRWLTPAAVVIVALLSASALWMFGRGRGDALPPASAGATPAAAQVTPVAGLRKSIAVLPFANLSGDKDNEYFADGVQEDVLTNLSRIRDLKVISRTSVMGYRGKNQNLREIARELGVGTLVEGSVRRAGNRVRVSAQLIDARTDERLWAENFDREMSDIFTIQSKIAQEIAQALEARLSPGEAAGLRVGRGDNLAAYELYRRGLAEFRKYRHEDNEAATVSFREAIAQDAKYAVAYAALSEAYSFKTEKLDAPLYWLDAAIQAAEYAVAIDPQCAEAYNALGAAYFGKGWFRRARAVLARALELNPNYATALGRLALIDQNVGDLAGAWQNSRRALEMDPKDATNYLRLGDIYFGLGEIEAGERWMRLGMQRLDDPAKQQQIEIQIAHSRREYARIVELFKARQASNLNLAAKSFGELPGRGPVGYYAAMASWHLGNLPETRNRIEIALRFSNPEGNALPSLDIGTAIVRRREGREADMREMARSGMPYFRQQIDAGSESPRDSYMLAIGAWLLGERELSDQQIERAMQAGLLLGRTDQADMLPETLAENPKFAAALVNMNQKIEDQRARIRVLEKEYP